MKEVVKASEAIEWESPDGAPNHRYMSLMFERDITPTKSMAAGIVTLPPGQEQQKLSIHEDGEEIYYVLQGKGQFVLNDKVVDVEKDMAVYVTPGTKHRAINTGDEDMKIYYVNCPSVFGTVGQYKEWMKDWKKVDTSVKSQ